ncbi:MAG: 23S rRNA pseudouridylate synthase B [Gammaproteobacteria bacterium]|nr:23S rRNA pseudouridylate synthase B [Gammaproteobacteria bacterium]|tara:strand:- start:2099 stop:2836 length:738 start_codon:yes stop_codon:yes gene_type:complete
MSEKLQKVLARAGFGSRREIESWIIQGRIKVNGSIAEIGARVDDADRIVVDGKKLSPQKKVRYDRRVILYNKPEDEICTRKDPEGRPTVFDKLPPLRHGRWVSIGRLDINTSGLLLFTTDGELANKLTHPSSMVEREYAVRVMGEVTPNMLQAMHQGIIIENQFCRFSDIQYYAGEGINQWYHVVIMEGRNREVRKLWESQGVKVSRLKRVRFGPIFIPSTVRKGDYQELSKSEVENLVKSIKSV